jgi:uncharacterized protein (DUF983 family)
MGSNEPVGEPQHPAPGTRYFRRALRLRCPVCGEGRLFRRMTMWQTCPVCGFPYEREPGYWTNAVTLNFMTTGGLAVLLITPLAYAGLPVLVVLALGLALGTLFPLLCFRHSKALWLAIDLCIRPPTTFERLAGFLHVSGQQAAGSGQHDS